MKNEIILDEMLEEIGEMLRNMRRITNEKQIDAAHGIGISRPELSRIENGKCATLNLKMLFMVLAYYNGPDFCDKIKEMLIEELRKSKRLHF